MDGIRVALLIDVPRDGIRRAIDKGTIGHVSPLFADSTLLLFRYGSTRVVVRRSAVELIETAEEEAA